MAGAPKGNTNAAKAKVWTAALERALERRGTSRIKLLDQLADRFIDLCQEGDLAAFKELGDRLEGKPAQTINAQHTGNIGLAHVLGTIGSAPDNK